MATDGKQIVLITGANTGLGLAAVKSMYSSPTPHHVIMAGRSAEKVSAAIAELQAEGPSPSGSTVEGLTLDITSDAAVAAAAEKVAAAHGRLDALVNNAGGSFDPEWLAGSVSRRESLNRTFDLNVSSVHAVTEAFVPLLAKSPNPRLLIVTSGMASLQEESTKTTPAENRIKPPVAGFPKPAAVWGMAGYRVSKTALNMLFLIWVRALAADNIRCFDVSPGFLATGLARTDPEVLKKAGALDPSVGGELIRDIVAGKRDSDAGLAVRADSVQPW